MKKITVLAMLTAAMTIWTGCSSDDPIADITTPTNPSGNIPQEPGEMPSEGGSSTMRKGMSPLPISLRQSSAMAVSLSA